MTETCSVPGCERTRKNYSNPLCYAHYMRKVRYGDPEYVIPPRPKKAKSACRIEDCDGVALRRGLCNKHYTRWRKFGDPNQGKDRQKPDHLLTYNGAHARVRAKYGRPSEYLCECGAQARDWAYQHNAGDEELTEYLSRGYVTGVVKYSPNPEHYKAMCRSCHTIMDKAAVS